MLFSPTRNLACFYFFILAALSSLPVKGEVQVTLTPHTLDLQPGTSPANWTQISDAGLFFDRNESITAGASTTSAGQFSLTTLDPSPAAEWLKYEASGQASSHVFLNGTADAGSGGGVDFILSESTTYNFYCSLAANYDSGYALADAVLMHDGQYVFLYGAGAVSVGFGSHPVNGSGGTNSGVLEAGAYTFRQGAATHLDTTVGTHTVTAEYTVRFEVGPVPEPSTGLLVLSGILMGLFCLKFRRKHI